MTLNGWFQIGVTLCLVRLTAIPLGMYMSRVFASERTFMDPLVRPLERGFYRLACQ